MEFEELQKIWDEQKGETMYAINESALYKRIQSKKRAESRKINTVEISLMIINSIVGIILFYGAIVDDEPFWDISFGVVMLITVVFLAFFRWKRKKKENTFDRTMLGELDHAISNAQSTIQIATIMVLYYFIPVGIFSVIKMIVQGASLEKWLLIIASYTLAFLLVRWEKRKCHIPRRENLVKLKRKLMED
ncbi:MAG: hypothetical protein Tsb0034_15600 [Ekhidna sp.]